MLSAAAELTAPLAAHSSLVTFLLTAAALIFTLTGQERFGNMTRVRQLRLHNLSLRWPLLRHRCLS